MNEVTENLHTTSGEDYCDSDTDESDGICDTGCSPENTTPDLKNCDATSEKRKYMELIFTKNEPISEKIVKELALSEGGLLEDSYRQYAWPLLLGIPDTPPVSKSIDEVKHHREAEQVILDVKRSLKRFPEDLTAAERSQLKEKLNLLILRVLTTHPELHYYQGYHDVAITLLRATGENTSFYLLEHLSRNHLKICLEKTIESTSMLLNYIYPILEKENETVYKYMEKAEVGTVFALPWFITWFGHTVTNYKTVVRIYDYFLVSDPLMPLYLSAAIILHRAENILMLPCDMGSIHNFISTIPDDLPWEQLLKNSTELFEKNPPEAIEKEAMERVKRENEQREKERQERLMRLQKRQNHWSLWKIIRTIELIRRIPVQRGAIFVSVFAAGAVLAFYLRS